MDKWTNRPHQVRLHSSCILRGKGLKAESPAAWFQATHVCTLHTLPQRVTSRGPFPLLMGLLSELQKQTHTHTPSHTISSTMPHSHCHIQPVAVIWLYFQSHSYCQSQSNSAIHSHCHTLPQLLSHRAHSVTHCHILSLSQLCHTLTFSLSFEFPVIFSRSHTHYHSSLLLALSHSHCYIHSHCHILSLLHTPSHCSVQLLALSHSHSHCHTLSLLHTPSHCSVQRKP